MIYVMVLQKLPSFINYRPDTVTESMQRFISQTSIKQGPRFKKSPAAAYSGLLFLLVLLTALFVSSLWTWLSTTDDKITTTSAVTVSATEEARKRFQPTPNCTGGNQACSRHYPTSTEEEGEGNSGVCPEYFRWIHEELRVWKEKGITREMVETAKKKAHFRLVVKNGRYFEGD